MRVLELINQLEKYDDDREFYLSGDYDGIGHLYVWSGDDWEEVGTG